MMVELAKPYHVYDVRARDYLGLTDHIQAEIAPGQALLYSLLPYAVTDLSVQAQDARGSFHASLQAQGRVPGMHCLRVEVLDPNGHAVKEYAQNVIAHEGSTSFSVPFALNDSEGVWRVRVRDVASGMMAATDLVLER